MNRDVLDEVKRRGHIRSDAELARALNCYRSYISRIRKDKCALGAGMILRIMDEYNVPLEEIRRLSKLRPAP